MTFNAIFVDGHVGFSSRFVSNLLATRKKPTLKYIDHTFGSSHNISYFSSLPYLIRESGPEFTALVTETIKSMTDQKNDYFFGNGISDIEATRHFGLFIFLIQDKPEIKDKLKRIIKPIMENPYSTVHLSNIIFLGHILDPEYLEFLPKSDPILLIWTKSKEEFFKRSLIGVLKNSGIIPTAENLINSFTTDIGKSFRFTQRLLDTFNNSMKYDYKNVNITMIDSLSLYNHNEFAKELNLFFESIGMSKITNYELEIIKFYISRNNHLYTDEFFLNFYRAVPYEFKTLVGSLT